MKVIDRRVKLPDYLKQNPEVLNKILYDYTDGNNG